MDLLTERWKNSNLAQTMVGISKMTLGLHIGNPQFMITTRIGTSIIARRLFQWDAMWFLCSIAKILSLPVVKRLHRLSAWSKRGQEVPFVTRRELLWYGTEMELGFSGFPLHFSSSAQEFSSTHEWGRVNKFLHTWRSELHFCSQMKDFRTPCAGEGRQETLKLSLTVFPLTF